MGKLRRMNRYRPKWTAFNQELLYIEYFTPLREALSYLEWIHYEWMYETAYIDMYLSRQ